MSKKKIIFLESGTKKRTIQSFLSSDYLIFATNGHLMELKKSGEYNLGVNLETFIPDYEIIPQKKGMISFWKQIINKENIETIYLATDIDREGERISKELIETLELNSNQYKRLLFYEITPRNIKQALAKPTELNKNLVEAQVCRQILDRMIGFCVSPILKKKINALSAGRVQSVVLKLIVDQEVIIKNFESKKEYFIEAKCVFIVNNSKKKVILKKVDFEANLITYPNKEQAENISLSIDLELQKVRQKEENRFVIPKPPFTTSLLLAEAKFQLGFSISQTTKIAQKLYEGVWVKNENKPIGLITYPRSDSMRINKDFLYSAYQYITQKWGKDYCEFYPKWTRTEKSINIQDAHEAIHPTYLHISPEDLTDSLTREEYQLYRLIFDHSLASLMVPARINKISYLYNTTNNHFFNTSENICQFAGFLQVNSLIYFNKYNVKLDSDLLNINKLTIQTKEAKLHQEGKPFRYNEGTLVQKLERLKIGRPSTYNSFGSLLVKRKYVEMDIKGHFVPCNLGIKVNNWLQVNFANLINENYTAFLESKLDEVSQGKNSYYNFIKDFWKNFSKKIKEVQ